MSALRKVLVVDDDPVVGKSFNRVLTDEKGYIVVTAQNAHEALKKIREERYDVVFTDIKMPGMDGVELAEQVKSRQPWIPIVIVTGYGTVDNEDRAKAAGVSAFLRKPLSPEMIEESAHDALLQPVATASSHAVPVEAAASVVHVTDLATPMARKVGFHVKNVALFLVAPFIGLAYALLLPLVGVAMLAWLGWQAFATNPKHSKTVAAVKRAGLFAAAPFIGLAFVVLLPLVGTVLLAWVGVRAMMLPSQVQ